MDKKTALGIAAFLTAGLAIYNWCFILSYCGTDQENDSCSKFRCINVIVLIGVVIQVIVRGVLDRERNFENVDTGSEKARCCC